MAVANSKLHIKIPKRVDKELSPCKVWLKWGCAAEASNKASQKDWNTSKPCFEEPWG